MKMKKNIYLANNNSWLKIGRKLLLKNALTTLKLRFKTLYQFSLKRSNKIIYLCLQPFLVFKDLLLRNRYFIGFERCGGGCFLYFAETALMHYSKTKLFTCFWEVVCSAYLVELILTYYFILRNVNVKIKMLNMNQIVANFQSRRIIYDV